MTNVDVNRCKGRYRNLSEIRLVHLHQRVRRGCRSFSNSAADGQNPPGSKTASKVLTIIYVCGTW